MALRAAAGAAIFFAAGAFFAADSFSSAAAGYTPSRTFGHWSSIRHPPQAGARAVHV